MNKFKFAWHCRKCNTVSKRTFQTKAQVDRDRARHTTEHLDDVEVTRRMRLS